MNRFLFLVIFFTASGVSFSHTRDTSIRKTNWSDYFAHSPDFAVDTGGFDSVMGQFYSIKADTSFADSSLSGGYPSLDYVQYGDIDGDDRDEALIFFYTGGTAESCSYVIIRQTENGPAFVDWGSGYKMGGTIRNDTLLVYQPVYVGWEPNCCPSSFETQFYRIKENKLFLTDFINEGIVEAVSNTVEQFYGLLSNRNYADAYDLLGDNYQTAHPFEKWIAGFKNTISIDAVIDTMRISDSTVHVTLTTIDSSAGAGNISNTFEGTWKLQWLSADDGWILAEANIKRSGKK